MKPMKLAGHQLSHLVQEQTNLCCRLFRHLVDVSRYKTENLSLLPLTKRLTSLSSSASSSSRFLCLLPGLEALLTLLNTHHVDFPFPPYYAEAHTNG